MATTTVVCPECGSPTAPGRYTCADCGAFLDGVSVTPRSWAPAPASAPEAAGPTQVAHEPAIGHEPVDAPVWLQAAVPAAEPASPAAADDGWDPVEESEPALDPLLTGIPGLAPADPPAPARPDDARDVQWPTREPAAPHATAAARPPAASPAPAPAFGAPLPVPEPRTPAGSWLPPSALLTRLDEANVNGGSAAAVRPREDGFLARALSGDWLAAFGDVDRRRATARQLIALGSTVTLISFLLPWANGSLGGLLNVWTSVWGLAGPGHWLVAGTVAALGVMAASSNRLASIPLGAPALALAAFLLGLVWSNLLSPSGRPLGALAVLVGVVLIGAGAALHPAARHEAATPDV